MKHNHQPLLTLQNNPTPEENIDFLESVHKKYFSPLFKYAYSRIHNKWMCEDLLQETFLKTWNYLKRGGEIVAVKSFLYHILQGLIIDEYRKQKFAPVSLDTLLEDGFDVATGEHLQKESSFDFQMIKKYINDLPEKYKNVLHMRLILSMSIEEISQTLHTTKNAITVQIHRGIKLVRSMHDEQIKQYAAYSF